MKYQKVGKTDINVSVVSFGCWELGGGDKWQLRSDEGNIKALRAAYKNGITTFDTAVNYGDGHSEEVAGIALEDIRKNLIIATKVRPDNLRAADVRTSVEASLKRLRTDYIDLLYVHHPNDEIPIEDTMSEFNKLKDEKIIKAIGVSNFSIKQLKDAAECAVIDAVQLEYSLLQRSLEDEILPYCMKNSISLMSYSSIAKGILSGAYHIGGLSINPDDFRAKRRLFIPEHMEKEKELILLMKEIADSKGVAISQIAVSWILQQPGMTSAIVGTQSEKHLMDNIKAADIVLTPAECEKLDLMSKKVLKSLI